MWKVYKIESGEILKAGFECEDEARDWYDARGEQLEGLYTIDEMDVDEQNEWLELQEKLEQEQDSAYEERDELDDYPDSFEEGSFSLPDEYEGAGMSVTIQDDI